MLVTFHFSAKQNITHSSKKAVDMRERDETLRNIYSHVSIDDRSASRWRVACVDMVECEKCGPPISAVSLQNVIRSFKMCAARV